MHFGNLLLCISASSLIKWERISLRCIRIKWNNALLIRIYYSLLAASDKNPTKLTKAKRKLRGFMGFRTCYPKICHLGILDILSRRNLRNSRFTKDFLTFLWSRSQNPCVRGSFPVLRGKDHPYLQRRRDAERNLKERALLGFPWFTTLSSYPLLIDQGAGAQESWYLAVCFPGLVFLHIGFNTLEGQSRGSGPRWGFCSSVVGHSSSPHFLLSVP